MTLGPAYGRDYKNKRDLLSDFYRGKDFILHAWDQSSTYINKAQIPLGTQVAFRYGQLRKVFIHVVANNREQV